MNDLDLARIVQRISVPIAAVVLAFIVGGILVAISGVSPIEALQTVIQAGFSCTPPYCNFGSVLATAAPLILTTLGAVMVLRAGLFSIGQEGQYGMGALAAAFIGYAIPMPTGLHAIVALLGAAIVGALFGSIPALFRIYLGANELIVSIIVNSIAGLILSYMINYPLRDSGGTASYTPLILDTAILPSWDPATKLGLNFALAVGFIVITWAYMSKSKWGYEQRMAGEASVFARYSGMKTKVAVIRAASLGGALAGIGGGIQVLGMNYRVIDGFMDGTGFNGLTAAILGGTTVIGGSLAAVLFSGITVGAVNGLQIVMGIPREIGSTLLALMILFVSIQAPLLTRLELWLSKRRGTKAMAEATATDAAGPGDQGPNDSGPSGRGGPSGPSDSGPRDPDPGDGSPDDSPDASGPSESNAPVETSAR